MKRELSCKPFTIGVLAGGHAGFTRVSDTDQSQQQQNIGADRRAAGADRSRAH